MFIKLIKVNGNNKKPIRSKEETTSFLSLVKLPLPGMAFSVPLCRELPCPWHWGRKAESVAGLAGTHQGRITLKNLSEAVSSFSLSKSGIYRGTWESSLFQEGTSARLLARQVLNLSFPVGFSAVTELPWLCSQTNLSGFEGNRVRPARPTPGTCFPGQAAREWWEQEPRPPPLGSPLKRCFLVSPSLESLAKDGINPMTQHRPKF